MFASVYHPQSNDAVEKANGLIFTAIKKCLFGLRKSNWADELPNVIWSYNITECRETRFTLFRLLYGAEAMSPEEPKHKSIRVLNNIEPSIEADLTELDIL